MLKKNILATTLTLCLGTLSVLPAAADFEAGIAANRAGDRATAFEEFVIASENGDERAYGKLASMYLYGLGTEKNYELAYVWFHMAYLAGEMEGERFRNSASSMLSRDEFEQAKQAAEAQRLKLGLEDRPE